MYIKIGDAVVILSGKDRLKTGKVIKIFFKEQKALVEGINIVTKHKASTQDDQKGNIIKEEMPIHISNLALIDPEKKIPTRVGIRYEEGKKIRYSKKTGIIL